MMKDPLNSFQVWEGQELGDDTDKEPGFYGLNKTPALVLHYAGAHATSTARKDRHGELHPAVWLRLLVKVVGTETYHIVEGIMEADIAVEFAEILETAAKRAPLDLEAHQGGNT